MAYIDGFVLCVPEKKLPAYKRMARVAARVWRDHGALDYYECVGDDMNVPFGMTFPKMVKPKRGEKVIFSWILYRSRAHRDRVNAKVMKDPRLEASCDPKNMPFDAKRMAWGGFKTLVKM